MFCIKGAEDCAIHSTDETATCNADFFPFDQSSGVLDSALVSESRKEMGQRAEEWNADEPLLRSYGKIAGHHIMASDGGIEYVGGIIVERGKRKIWYLSRSMRSGLPGKKVSVPFVWLTAIDRKTIVFDPCPMKDRARQSSIYAPKELISKKCRTALHDYYSRPICWKTGVEKKC